LRGGGREEEERLNRLQGKKENDGNMEVFSTRRSKPEKKRNLKAPPKLGSRKKVLE